MLSDHDFRAAFHEHKDAVYGFAWRMTGAADIAEDIAQETFLELMRSPGRFQPERGSLRSFLLGIARHRLSRRWREAQRWDPLADEQFVAAPFDPSAAQRRDLVGAAVQSLPPLQREALVLFEYEGFTLEEVALAVSAEVGTVKSRLHRARDNLRRMLEPFFSRESQKGEPK